MDTRHFHIGASLLPWQSASLHIMCIERFPRPYAVIFSHSIIKSKTKQKTPRQALWFSISYKEIVINNDYVEFCLSVCPSRSTLSPSPSGCVPWEADVCGPPQWAPMSSDFHLAPARLRRWQENRGWEEREV